MASFERLGSRTRFRLNAVVANQGSASGLRERFPTVNGVRCKLTLTNDEAAVLLALERLATYGLEWKGDDPDDDYGMGSHFPGSVSFWLLAMYVAGIGDVTTSNRISSALRALCMLGFVKEEIVHGPPDWLHDLPQPPKSRPMLCPDGRLVHFALDPLGRLLITRPDRPDWQWPVDYSRAQDDTRFAIAPSGALAARSLVSGPPWVLSTSEQTQISSQRGAIQLRRGKELDALAGSAAEQSPGGTESNDDVVVAIGRIDPTKPNAIGYVTSPSDQSSYVPMATIRTDYCKDLTITSIKEITKILEDFPTNGVRWTRPPSGKTGKPNPQRRSVHLVDWETFVIRLKGRSPESTESGFPDLTSSEIDAAKAKVRRNRQVGK